MKFSAMTVGAASKILLNRARFGEGILGQSLVDFFYELRVDSDSWVGFACAESSTCTILTLPDEGDEIVLVSTPDVWNSLDRSEAPRFADRVLRVFVTIARGSRFNPSWRVYHSGSRISVFATPTMETELRRLCFDEGVKRDHNIVTLYGIGPLEAVADLDSFAPGEAIQEGIKSLSGEIRTLAASAKAIKATRARRTPISDHFTSADFQKVAWGTVAGEHTFEYWTKNVTIDQERFIADKVEQPIRLHGAAGTGKTLALLLKTLSECERAGDGERILLLAHSATMRDLLAASIEALDPVKLRRGQEENRLSVSTLFDWCLEFLAQEVKPGQLLDQDAAESKSFQIELVRESIERTFTTEWRIHRPHCSAEMRKLLEDERSSSWTLTLFQHELACVLKGNRIQPFNLPGYLELSRPRHTLPISTEGDRKFVFAVYKDYETQLQEFGVFDADDIIVEVLNRLESPLWSRQRQALGFDMVLLDEAHVLNDNERSLVRYLLRDAFGLPRIVMVLDLLQVVGDRGVREDSQGRLVTPTSTTDGTRSELAEVHRSTPAILDFAQAVITCGSELYDHALVARSLKAGGVHGQIPEMYACMTPTEQAAKAFRVADGWRKLGWARHDIGIICLSEESLAQVLDYSAAKNKPVRVIDRRGDLEAFADAERFSCFMVMAPEFSAGLQFRGVVLVDLSEGRVPSAGSESAGARSAMLRRAVSEVYLAISRATERVAVIVDQTSGPSSLLQPALEAGYVVKGVTHK